MRDFSIVLKTIARQRWRSMWELKAGSKVGRIAATVLIVIAFLVLIGVWCFMCGSFMYMLRDSGTAHIMLFGAFFAATLMTLIFCIASVIGNLFQTVDAQLLAAMPLRQGAVFFARFAMIYGTELLITLAFCLPAVICYAIVVGGGAWTIVVGVVCTLLLPALPLALASLLSILLMRSSAFMRHREKIMTVFGVLFAVVCSFGGQLLGQTMGAMPESELNAMMGGFASALGSASMGYPPAKWAAEATGLVGGYGEAGIKWLLFLVCCIAALAIAGLVSSRMYYKGLSAASETATAKKKGSTKLDKAAMVKSSPMRAFLRRERMSVMRSPVYATNCLLGVVMFPLMIAVIPIITSFRIPDDVATGANILTLYPTIFAELGAPAGLVYGCLFALCMLVTFANITACTAISREGEGFALTKSLPVRYSTQCYGKLIFAAITNVITMMLTAAVAIVFVHTFWLEAVLAGISASVASIASAAIGMLVDVLRPKLKWQTEAEAVKQNVNGFFGMLVNMFFAVLIALPTFFLALNFGTWVGFGVSIAMGAALTALSVFVLGRAADANLPKVLA